MNPLVNKTPVCLTFLLLTGAAGCQSDADPSFAPSPVAHDESDAASPPGEDAARDETSAPERSTDSGADSFARKEEIRPSKAAACTATFGAKLTDSFGRIDGTVLAVVRPVDRQCPKYNNDHVVLQVQMGGEAYRLVINVASSRPGQDPRVRFAEHRAPLPAPAWEDGWHPGVSFDYSQTLGVHSDAFSPYDMDDLIDLITAKIDVGSAVSVYARSSGGSRASSAHLIHKNSGAFNDGAIVLDAAGEAPRFLLFHFASQSF